MRGSHREAQYALWAMTAAMLLGNAFRTRGPDPPDFMARADPESPTPAGPSRAPPTEPMDPEERPVEAARPPDDPAPLRRVSRPPPPRARPSGSPFDDLFMEWKADLGEGPGRRFESVLLRALDVDREALERLLNSFARETDPILVAEMSRLIGTYITEGEGVGRGRAIEAMIGLVVSGSTDPPRQTGAAACLREAWRGSRPSSETIDRLAWNAKEHEVPAVRAALTEIVGAWLDPPRAHDFLLPLLEDPDPGVRRAAAGALDRAIPEDHPEIDRPKLARRVVDLIRSETEPATRTELALRATHLAR